MPPRGGRSALAAERGVSGGSDVVRQQRRPAAVVAVAPVGCLRPRVAPSRDARSRPASCRPGASEPDLDVVASARSRLRCHGVAEARRWLPGGDLAPVVLDRRPAGARRSGRRDDPPARRSGRPPPVTVWSAGHQLAIPAVQQLERVVDGAGDLEGEPDRLDHRSGGRRRCSPRRGRNGPPRRPRPARGTRGPRRCPRRASR